MNRSNDALEGARPPDDLVSSLYHELRRLAAAELKQQRPGHTLQATALVNEAWLKVANRPDLKVQSREEFLRLASRIMRNLLVDHARGKQAIKRGKDWERVTLHAQVEERDRQFDVLVLDELLSELSALSELKANLIELRFFAGLNETEAAGVLGISRTEATRQWRMARAWLFRKLSGGDPTE